ncbi:MAG: hypothetical protein WCF18_04725, partial [Chthoniobacteraceae bacterium]
MKSIPTPRKPAVVKVGNTAVRIYGTPESGKPRYTVVHYEGGKRLRRTFVNLDQAKREAELVATKLENGQRAVLELTPPDRESYA